jgi:hypothetical protein
MSIMMHKIAIGLAAAVIATGGSTLIASAYRGGGSHGGGMSHDGGYSKGGMGRIGMGRGGHQPGRVYGLEGRRPLYDGATCLRYPHAPQCRRHR